VRTKRSVEGLDKYFPKSPLNLDRFRNHLRWYLSAHHARLNELLSETEIKDLFDFSSDAARQLRAAAGLRSSEGEKDLRRSAKLLKVLNKQNNLVKAKIQEFCLVQFPITNGLAKWAQQQFSFAEGLEIAEAKQRAISRMIAQLKRSKIVSTFALEVSTYLRERFSSMVSKSDRDHVIAACESAGLFHATKTKRDIVEAIPMQRSRARSILEAGFVPSQSARTRGASRRTKPLRP